MKRLGIAGLFIGTLCSIFAIGLIRNGGSPVQGEGSNTTLSYTFNTSETYADFGAYYAAKSTSSSGSVVEFAENFEKTDSSFKTIRTRSMGSSDNISYLTLTGYVFDNFQAEITSRFCDTLSWGWMGLSFAQKTPGAGFMSDGGFAGMEQECKALIWGSPSMGQGPYEGSAPSTVETQTEYKTLKVSLIGQTISIDIYNKDGAKISSSSHTHSEISDTEGYVSLTSVDNFHEFSSFSITHLDELGNPIALKEAGTGRTSVSITNKISTLKVHDSYTLSFDGDDSSDLALSSSNNDCIVAGGSTITAIAEGKSTIKAYYKLKPTIFDSFDVTVKGLSSSTGRRVFDFTSIHSLNGYTLNYVPNASGEGAGNITDPSLYWGYDETYKAIVRINDRSDDSADDIASVFLPSTYSDYEFSLVFKNTNKNKGWVGLFGGQSDSSKRFMDSGYGVFVQAEGYPTVWGARTNGTSEVRTAYDQNAWHILRAKIYSGNVDVYVDDLNTPLLHKEYGDDVLNSGHIGLFSSGAGYAIKTMMVGAVSSTGDFEDYNPVSTFSVEGVPSTAKVGDTSTLIINLNDDATNKNVVLECDDSNICIAKNSKLTFIGEGTVNLKIYPEDNSDFEEDFTIIVSAKANSGGSIASVPNGYGSDSSSGNGESGNSKDSGASLGVTNVVLLSVASVGLVGLIVYFVLTRGKKHE